MKIKWRPHFYGHGYSIAKYNGCSIIRASRELNSHQRNHLSIIGGAMYEVMDKEGEIHRFNSRKEMEQFVEGEDGQD